MEDWTPEKPEVPKQVTVADLIGNTFEESFLNFDVTEVQELLSKLQDIHVPDLAHAEFLQQEALRCADILTEYIAKLVKTIHYLEAKVSRTKASKALYYEPPAGVRQSIELRKMAGDESEEVEKLQIKLAKAKGSKIALDRKYEIVVKAHHHYKDIASGFRRTMMGYSTPVADPDKD